MFTRALPEVSNLRKLYASKEGTGRIKVLVLNESSMPMELSGKKINTPRKFVPQQEKYDPTSFQGTQAQDDLPPQDHKQKGKDKLQEEIDAFEEAPKALVKWVQDYIKFYFIKYDYNSKDPHQDDVDPEEEELESS